MQTDDERIWRRLMHVNNFKNMGDMHRYLRQYSRRNMSYGVKHPSRQCAANYNYPSMGD